MKTCDVLIHGNIDQPFTYMIPNELLSKICVGNIVTVPLGNRKVQGIVISIGKKSDIKGLKNILNLKYDIKVLNKHSLGVINKTSDYFLQSRGKFCSKLIPKAAIRYQIKYRLKSKEGASKREKEILSLIKDEIEKNELLRHTTRSTINNMLNHGLIEEIKNIQPCNNNTVKTEYTDFSKIAKSNAHIYERGISFIMKSPTMYDYINKIILNNLQKGEITLIIVPQLFSHQFLVDFLRNLYGERLCVYTSALSHGDGNTAFYNIISGKSKIIIGTGDAMFLPYSAVGSLIFLMPESPYHFHYEIMPYYNAEIVAGFFANEYSIPLYIIGQNPSVNLIPSIENGKTRYLHREVDEKQTIFLKSKNLYNMLTKQILTQIKRDLSEAKRILIVYNQLGYFPFVRCNTCGSSVKCPACDSPLVFTGKSNLYYCPKCKKNFTIRKCPECGSLNLRFSGMGMEKLASRLRDALKGTKIATLSANDNDSLQQLGSKNIIISTSFIFKDLYPYKFDTIILPSIETILNENVIKSEWNFVRIIEYLKSFLNPEGKMILQSPIDYDFIPYLISGNLQKYISFMLSLRKKLNYPPYSHIISLQVSDSNLLKSLYEKLSSKFIKNSMITVTDNAIIIKTKKLSDFTLLKSLQRKKEIRIYVDSEKYL